MTISEWISLGAFLVAGLALWLNWKTRRDYRLNLEPVVTLTPKGPKSAEIALALRSVSNIGFRIKCVTVVWPWPCRISSRDDMVPTGENRHSYVWQRTIRPRLSVLHAGADPRVNNGKRDFAEVDFAFSPKSRAIWEIAVMRWKLTRWLTRSERHSIRAHFIIQVETERGATLLRYRSARMEYPPPAHG